MNKPTLEEIVDLFNLIGALGTVVFGCLSMKGGLRLLGKLDSVIVGVLLMVFLFLLLGNRVFSWWPRLYHEMAAALMFCNLAFVYYRNWRRNLAVDLK